MTKSYIDLHCHSIYSGGCFTPRQLIQLAKQENLKVISLTDHNTIAGTKELLQSANQAGIKALPGVEIYTTYKRKLLHLLIYNFNLNNKEFNQKLKILCQKRIKLINYSIERLKKYGFKMKPFGSSDIHYPDLTIITNQLINNKYNLAKVKKITQKGLPDLFTLINAFLAKGKAAYLPETSLSIDQVLGLAKKINGLPILAHPGQQLRWSEDYLILELKKLGLKGLEVFTPYHNWHQIEHYQELARQHKLLITGGSDFHCNLPQKNILVTHATDYFKVPISIFNKLKPYL